MLKYSGLTGPSRLGIFRVGDGEDLRVDIEERWAMKDGILIEGRLLSRRTRKCCLLEGHAG